MIGQACGTRLPEVRITSDLMSQRKSNVGYTRLIISSVPVALQAKEVEYMILVLFSYTLPNPKLPCNLQRALKKRERCVNNYYWDPSTYW